MTTLQAITPTLKSYTALKPRFSSELTEAKVGFDESFPKMAEEQAGFFETAAKSDSLDPGFQATASARINQLLANTGTPKSRLIAVWALELMLNPQRVVAGLQKLGLGASDAVKEALKTAVTKIRDPQDKEDAKQALRDGGFEA
jgi:hypothetical protein